MRILYAAGNRYGSFYQLKRFLESIAKQNHIIKVAAYKKSMGDLDVDYMLDSLLNFTNPDSTVSFNGNYSYYRNEIKRFNPDLIISDLELYSSVLANELNIKLWQVSPMNLYYGLNVETKSKVGIHKHYSYLIESNHKRCEYVNYALTNSNRRFVLSHLCDCDSVPALIEGYEWARPSFILGEGIGKFDNVIALARTNKKVINEFRNKSTVLFSPYVFESYEKLLVVDDEIVYRDALDGCRTFVSDGTPAFLADAFYNQKYCFSFPRYDDIDTIVASYMNEHCGIGKIDMGSSASINININDDVKFISEYLDEL